jgi:histidinol-phosphate aminotransferase
VIEALLLVRLPYHLSSLTQAAAEVAVEHSPRLKEQIRHLCRTRDEFVAAVSAKGWQCAPSDANFVLVGPFADPGLAWHRLLDQGILVRNVGLPPWLRVTIGTDEQMTALVDALGGLEDLRERT